MHRFSVLQTIDVGVLPEFVAAIQSGFAATQHAATWGVQHMAGHGAAIADQLAAAGVLQPLVAVYCGTPGDLQATAKSAAKEVMRHCTSIAPLLALVQPDVPAAILASALRACLRIMQESVTARRDFVSSGALLAMQQLEHNLDDKGRACVHAINGLFPKDVVSYYRKGVQSLRCQVA